MTLWLSLVLGFGFIIGVGVGALVLVFVLALIFGFRTFCTAFMESYRKSYHEAADKKRAEKENRGAEVKLWPGAKGH